MEFYKRHSLGTISEDFVKIHKAAYKLNPVFDPVFDP